LLLYSLLIEVACLMILLDNSQLQAEELEPPALKYIGIDADELPEVEQFQIIDDIYSIIASQGKISIEILRTAFSRQL
jgi:hypothetical protein